jgi:hypothetical protein
MYVGDSVSCYIAETTCKYNMTHDYKISSIISVWSTLSKNKQDHDQDQ